MRSSISFRFVIFPQSSKRPSVFFCGKEGGVLGGEFSDLRFGERTFTSRFHLCFAPHPRLDLLGLRRFFFFTFFASFFSSFLPLFFPMIILLFHFSATEVSGIFSRLLQIYIYIIS